MIDLKRDNKNELVPATGIRTLGSSIYTPHQTDDFKISRGKFSDFLTFQRCFYLDRVCGLESPGTPAWSLNATNDLLLKKEFDKCREDQVPHRLFIANGLKHFVPFKHPDMDKWRNSLQQGLSARFKDTNIILIGGVDDIWRNTLNDRLIIVDYKSQASSLSPEPPTYLSDPYHEAYKIQLDFYVFLLQQMGFKVESIAYF